MTFTEICDSIANEQYGVDYSMLTDSQKVGLTQLITLRFARQEIQSVKKLLDLN